MNITYSGNSKDQDLDLSENEDRMADFSARYRQDFRIFKAKLKADEREYQKWSLSGGNYSTTTEFDWKIKITKNYTLRSFRKGGKDIVFDISGLTLDSLSREQIEKNLDADYLWKYGKNRTKTTTLPTTISTTTQSTSTISSTISSAFNTTSTDITVPTNTIASEEKSIEEDKSIINSEFDRMTSKDHENYAKKLENNWGNYEQVGHEIFAEPLVVHREKRNIADGKHKTKSVINQVIKDRMKIENYYLNDKKSKMHFLHELPKLSPGEINGRELALQMQLNNFLQNMPPAPRQKYNAIRNSRRHFRRRRRGVIAEPREDHKGDYIEFNEKNFNQQAHPDHPVFYLTEEDLENGNFKNYNASYIHHKLHEKIDEMFEDLKLNHDSSEEEKIANSVYYRKYLEKRTTPFFNRLAEVIGGDNKRAIQEFTYPPNYDFDPASVRDPNKEPYLMELKKSYERKHAKSLEEMRRDIELAKQGKLNTAAWRKEAEEHVRNLPDDNN